MPSDPIQTVLEAQARARGEVEAEREAAARRIADAQDRARAIRERNERRTLRAIRRFEQTCADRIEAEVKTLGARAGRIEEHFEKLCEERLDGVIARAVRTLWPDA